MHFRNSCYNCSLESYYVITSHNIVIGHSYNIDKEYRRTGTRPERTAAPTSITTASIPATQVLTSTWEDRHLLEVMHFDSWAFLVYVFRVVKLTV